jgi:2-polyprenyl-6-hydroxyphenyl methylase/3-demethylubiquinone-9 3-methyltransferase
MSHALEVEQGRRFEFGKNWWNFLSTLNDDRIATAVRSLQEMLEVNDLAGRSFLDIGCGSGLFSLAAYRLGADVHSFDYDPTSVACAQELRRRYGTGTNKWTIAEGSALDVEYIASLGTFDIVYSWGVLHHTGNMWLGLTNAERAVAPGGKLFVAIYNDTGTQARRWLAIKKTYNKLPPPLRAPFAAIVTLPEAFKDTVRGILNGHPGAFIDKWKNYASTSRRGMTYWNDVLDWVGGYPYEVATPDEIFEFYKARGYTLTKMRCGGVGLGCNEFVFVKTQSASAPVFEAVLNERARG